MKESDGGGQRRITLFCPSLPKLTHMIAWDEHKLDLGSIARIFGLDPNTLKLNGHFISRGVDLVASTVTWRSLIGYFSVRGLSTGVAGSSPLVVDGKLSKIGSKRLCGPAETKGQDDAIRKSKKPQLESANGDLWLYDGFHGGLGLKRKTGSVEEDASVCVKRPKSNVTTSCVEERRGLTSCVVPCGFMSKTIKRMRDVDDDDDVDRVAVVSPLKKTR